MDIINIVLIVFALSMLLLQALSVRSAKGADVPFARSTALYTALIGVGMLIGNVISGGGFTVHALWVGIIFGALFVACMRCYGAAMATGPVSYTVFYFSASMLIPVILNVLIWKESLTWGRIAGVLLFLVAFYLIQVTGVSNEKKADKKWILLCLGVFVTNGLLAVMPRVYYQAAPGGSATLLMACGFLAASVLCVIQKDFWRKGQHIGKSAWLPILGIAIGTAMGNLTTTYLAARIPNTILFPLVCGGLVVVSTIVSRVFFKEKLSKGGMIGLFIGLLAVVFINF